MKKLIILLVLTLFSINGFCASAARKAIEQNFFVSHSASASDDNGGTNGASPTDETTNGAPLESGAAGTTNGTTFTDAAATFQTNGVTGAAAGSESDYMNIHDGGVGATPDLYKIVSVTNETTLELASAPGNSAGDVQYNIGGSFASIQQAADEVVKANSDGESVRINVKSDSAYTLAASIDIDQNAGEADRSIIFESYNTSVGDVLDGSTTGLAAIDGNDAATNILNITVADIVFIGFDMYESTGPIINGSNAAADRIQFIRCSLHDPDDAGADNDAVVSTVNGAASWNFMECTIYNSNGTEDAVAAVGGSHTFSRCFIRASANASSWCVDDSGASGLYLGNIFDGNSTGNGVNVGGTSVTLYHNLFFECVDGIAYVFTTRPNQRVFSNVFHSCTNGIDGTANTGGSEVYGYNAFYNNTNDFSADAATTLSLENNQSLSAEPYIDTATFDFDINNTATAGVLLQSNAWGKFLDDGTITLSNTSNKLDIGPTAYEGAGGGTTSYGFAR